LVIKGFNIVWCTV